MIISFTPILTVAAAMFGCVLSFRWGRRVGYQEACDRSQEGKPL